MLMWRMAKVDTFWVIPSTIMFEDGLLIFEVGFKA